MDKKTKSVLIYIGELVVMAPVSYTHLDVYKRQVLSIKDQLNIPVKFIGLGEKLDDLQEFDLEQYIYLSLIHI